MKAVLYRKEKGLVLEEVATPAPNMNQVLVRIANCGFCGSDHSMVQSGTLVDGYILGHEMSGTVVQAGIQTQGVEIGQKVMIRPTFCGQCRDCRAGNQQFCQNNRRSIGIGDLPGAFAEYVVCYPEMLIPIPEGVDSRNAALAELFATIVHGMKVIGNKQGSVLVLGGGPIGLSLIKLLKLRGFGPIGLCEPQEYKRALAKKWGADFTLDPLNETPGGAIFQYTGGHGFDMVYECSGVPDNVQVAMDCASRFGAVCLLSIIGAPAQISPLTLNFKEVRLTGAYGNTHEDNIQVMKWMAGGQLDGREMISDLISLQELPEVFLQRIRPGKAIKVMLRIGPGSEGRKTARLVT